MAEKDARLELARRYFAHYGPATVRDVAYFFGKPQREVKMWMAQLPLVHARVEGQDCFWLDNGQNDWPEMPDCLFLAGFDQLMLGYLKTESIFLAKEYIRGIFHLSGIVMAPILLRGRVAGRWKQKNGRLTLTLFSHWTARDRKRVEQTAEKLWTVKQVVWEEN